MTLKNGFGKCSLFVLSADGRKDQIMDSLFSCQRKPSYGEGIVRLANRVVVWRQSQVSFDFQKVLGHEVFSAERSLNQLKATRLCICSINQSNRSVSVRFRFEVIRKSLYQDEIVLGIIDSLKEDSTCIERAVRQALSLAPCFSVVFLSTRSLVLLVNCV